MNKYPSEQELKQITEWSPEDPKGLIEFLKDNWHWPSYITAEEKDDTIFLELHTGGWSGNEDIVVALEKNMFWSLWWMRSERGGHYWFEVRKLK